MIITVTELTQDLTKTGAEYVKVKGVTQDGQESTKSIFNNLKDSWPLLEVGATLDFTMEKKGQFWNVTAINPAGEKPAIKPVIPPIAKTPQTGEITIRQPLPFINPQEKGMWWKEVGENFRAGLLKKDNPAGLYLWQQYIKQMLASLEIKIDVKKEVAKEEVKSPEVKSPLVAAAQKMGATIVTPEEIPF